MSDSEVLLVGLGVALVLMAFYVELEHKIIWKRYKKSYHKHQNQFVDTLLKPNIWVYRLNVYIAWPLVLILGVALIVQNA